MTERGNLTLGALLGSRYRLEARVGAGGMGVVYRARDERLGRSVALKVVSKDGGASAVRRLLREARAVASLDHRGIAMVFDAFDEPQLGVVLVMELIRGKTLRELLAAGPRAPREAARLVVDIAESLAAAHRVGLVHRDVKPDNVMVREDGRTALLDFGIAKAMAERRDSSGQLPDVDTADLAGHIVGTPEYMAPEQAIASGEITGATDQFALAVLAFETLAGQSPWRGARSNVAILARVLRAAPPRVTAVQPALPQAVDGVLARGMARMPAERYPSIDAFAKALASALDGAAAAAPRVSAPARAPDTSAPELPFARTERASERVARGPRRARALRVAVAFSAAIAVASLAGWRARLLFGAPGPTPGIRESASASAPKAVTYADIMPSATTNDAAAKAFHQAMLDLRDADDDGARQALDDALRLDPDFAAARLQRAIVSDEEECLGSPRCREDGRADFLTATRGRDAMNARDRALLDAWEPTFNRVPADVTATAARVSELATRFQDAWIWHMVGRLRYALRETRAAAGAFAREAELDPRSARARDWRGRILRQEGDLRGAREMYERCIEIQPRAFSCRQHYVDLLDETGDCEAFSRRAREFVTLAPSDSFAIERALNAAAASGADRATLEAMIGSREDPLALNCRAWVHEIYGELGDGAASLATVEAQAVAGRNSMVAAYAHIAQIIELDEAGRRAAAVRLASSYEARLASLPPIEDEENEAEVFRLLAFLRREGRLSAETLRERRRAWLASHRKADADKETLFRLWTVTYAFSAIDEEGAEEANAALPSFVEGLPPPRTHWLWSWKEAVARAFVLGGRADARPFVDAALSDCTPNFYSIRARYLSGRTYETAGDIPSACAEYARVLARWGHASPGSVTADAAKKRMRALACPPADGDRR